MSDRAVILAGGKGTRLRPYTVVLPKPLMPVGEYPVLEIIVRQLARQQFRHLTLAVNHQADIIQAFFGDGQKWDVAIDYSIETMPLGTVAPLLLIPDLPENFVLINGDVLTDLNIRALFERHVSGSHLFTIAATRRKHTIDYGVLHVDDQNILTGFSEKPSLDHLVSMGVYVVNKTVLSDVPRGVKYGFDDLMLGLLAANKKVAVERHNGYWLDIGRPDDYMRAIDEFDQIKDGLIGHG